MTKAEFASAWRMLRSILMAYLEYVKARITEKAARALVTPEMFLGQNREDTPEWKAWTRAWTVRQAAHDAMMEVMDSLDCSDVGELLREDEGPYELDVDPDDEPAVRSMSDLDIVEQNKKAVRHGSQQEPGVGRESGQGDATQEAGSGQDTPGD